MKQNTKFQEFYLYTNYNRKQTAFNTYKPKQLKYK